MKIVPEEILEKEESILIKVSKQISVEIVVPHIGIYILDTVQNKRLAILPSELPGLSKAIAEAMQNFQE